MIRNVAASLLIAAAAVTAAPAAGNAETAIFAGGCFWCVESDMDHVKGVSSTISGYIGGTNANPTYHNYAENGHREAVKVTFDSSTVSYEKLVDIFLHSIDVTDAGGQFCDRGHAYSTAIYTIGADQVATAKKVKAEDQKELGQTIVTEIAPAPKFWPAEDYHQNYYKGTGRILSRFGYVTQASAYKGYREGCGRDARVKAVWGASADKGIAGH